MEWDKYTKFKRQFKQNIALEKVSSMSQVVQPVQSMHFVTKRLDDWAEIPLITMQAPTIKMHGAHSFSLIGSMKKVKYSKPQKFHNKYLFHSKIILFYFEFESVMF